jgi:CrcB protein
MGSEAEAVGAPSPKPDATDGAVRDLGVRGARRSRRHEPRVLAAVALGGALGAPARYSISQVVHITPGTFPWGTFWTNVSGSFALGFILAFLLERFPPSRFLHPFVATGFLGAYTTYSTFAVETDLLVKNGHADIALAYVTGSFGVGFAAVWIGIVLARTIPERRRHSHET